MSAIRDWLKAQGLAQYADAFEQNDIDEGLLPDLTDDGLEKLGVVSMGHRMKLLKAIGAGFSRGVEPIVATPTLTSKQTEPPRDAERRQITVMFCDLVGSTALAEELDPEDLRTLMQTYQRVAGGAVDRYEGHVAQYLGDGLMVYFGWPRAHEDDAERAVRAGLEIVDSVKEIAAPQPLAVRIGIATGPVVVGETGAGDASVPKLAVGQTPNLAARLQGLAGADEIMIAEATRRLTSAVLETVDLGEHSLKGIVEPVRAHRVGGLVVSEGRFAAAHGVRLTPFVGREAERALLAEKWEQAKDGEGQLVLICGEPGIGKSRLVETAREHAMVDGGQTFLYQCSPFHTNTAFHPISQTFAREARFDTDDSPKAKLDKIDNHLRQIGLSVDESAPLIAAALSIPVDDRYPPLSMSPQKQKERTVEALAEAMTANAKSTPVLFLVEDMHWADASSLETASHIIERLRDLRMLAVITFRPEFTPSWRDPDVVTTLTLARLRRTRVGELIANVTGGMALPETVTAEIIAKTDGVPLFVEELTKTVLESGLVEPRDGAYVLTGPFSGLAIPDTLQDSLMARLDRLAPMKEVAQIGACIGREFSFELLAALSPLGDDALADALTQLVNSELIFAQGTPPETTYTFKHALIQDAAYETLLRSKRYKFHAKIAEVLSTKRDEGGNIPPELIAYHLTAARLSEMAVPLWLEAGKLSLAQNAHSEALEHLKRGLGLISDLPETAERDKLELDFHMAMASSHNATSGWASDQTKQAYDAARSIMSRTGNDESQFNTLVGIFYFYNVRGLHDEAVPLIKEALRLSDGKGPDSDARKLVAYQAYGQSNLWRGNFARSVEYFEKSMSAYNQKEHVELAQIWGADFYASDLTFLGIPYWVLGFPELAWSASQSAFEHAHRLDQPLILAWVGSASYGLLVQRRFQEAVANSVECRELARELDADLMYAAATKIEGCARIGLGQNRDGLELLRDGINAWSELGGRVHVPAARSYLAMGEAAIGRFDEGIKQIELGLAEAQEGGEHWSDSMLYQRRGEIEVTMGKWDEAARSFGQALDIARLQDAKGWELRASVSLARLWQSLGQGERARDLLAPIFGWFTEGFDTVDLEEAKALLDELH